MTVLLLATTAFARPWFDRSDTDDDGVRDRHDVCIRIPETRNGYNDGDGCPDTLGSITVGSTFSSRIVEDATVLIEARNQREVGTGTATLTDLMPGDKVHVAASYACYAAEAEVEVTDGPRRIRLQLEPALFGDVSFLVRDANGRSVERAVLVPITTEPAGCVLPEATELPGGFGVVRLGVGTHTIGIKRAGKPYAYTFEVTGEPDQNVVIDVPSGERRAGGELLAEMVFFESGSDVISDEARKVLSAVASQLKADPRSRVVVEGHADSRAWGPYNEQLSMRRAENVIEVLAELGVDRDRMFPEAQGEREPLDTSGTPEGLAKNRRVQFIVRRGGKS